MATQDCPQDPAERPVHITDAYVLSLLARVPHIDLPRDLLPAFLQYLINRAILVRDGDSLELGRNSSILTAPPAEACAALRNHIISHVWEGPCPHILTHLILAPRDRGPIGTDMAVSTVCELGNNPFDRRVEPAFPELIKKLRWDRQAHLAELSAFGSAAPAVFQHGVARIESRASAPTQPLVDWPTNVPHPGAIQALGIRDDDLWRRWTAASAWACGGGFRSSPSVSRQLLAEMTYRIVKPATAASYPALRDLWEGLTAIRRFEALSAGSRMVRGRCGACGTLHERSSGRCRLAVLGCAGLVDESESMSDLADENNRLLRALHGVLYQATLEVVGIAGGVVAVPTASPPTPPAPRTGDAHESPTSAATNSAPTERVNKASTDAVGRREDSSNPPEVENEVSAADPGNAVAPVNATRNESERPIPSAATDLAIKNILAHFLRNKNTSARTEDLHDVSKVSERKTEDSLRLMHSRCRRCEGDPQPCPDHLGLLEHEPGKTRGWHRATDWGLEVARRQQDTKRPPGRKS